MRVRSCLLWLAKQTVRLVVWRKRKRNLWMLRIGKIGCNILCTREAARAWWGSKDLGT